MKKIICICLALLLCFGLFGCQKGNDDPANTPPPSSSGDKENENSSETPSSSSGEKENENSQEEPLEPLPPLSDDEMETVTITPDDFNYVYGEIIEKWENALTMKMDTPRMVNTWGEIVYIMTDEADKWCVGDEIDVIFSESQRPHDTAQYVRIIADVR